MSFAPATGNIKLDTVPNLNKFVGALLAVLITSGLLGSLDNLDQYSMIMLVAGILQIVLLIFVNVQKNAGISYSRIGFHAGIFGYLLSLPLLVPDKLMLTQASIRNFAGISIILGIVGFEIGYWLMRRKTPNSFIADFRIEHKHYQRTIYFVMLGLLMYLIYVVYVAGVYGANFSDIFFNMRGSFKFNQEEAFIQGNEFIGKIIGHIFIEGRTLAAWSGCILLTTKPPPGMTTPYLLSIFGMFLALVTGFYDGSRAVFAYTTIPTVTTIWILLSRSPTLRPLRFAYLFAAFVAITTVWAIMTELRGKDIETRSFDWEKTVKFYEYFSGATIYSDFELVISDFYDRERFLYGRSLVPLFLGWVPRFLWTDKPLPFTQVVNEIRGISLSEVSLACSILGEGYGNFGLPGCLLWCFGLGLFGAFLDNFSERFRPNSPLILPLKVFHVVWIAQLTRGGVPEMFYMSIFAVFLIYGLIWLTSGSTLHPLTRELI